MSAIVREASLRNYSLSIFYVQFYFLLSVFYFYYYYFLLFFTAFCQIFCKAQTDIKAVTVLFKTNHILVGRHFNEPAF